MSQVGDAAVMAIHDGIARILHIILVCGMVLIATLLPLFLFVKSACYDT